MSDNKKPPAGKPELGMRVSPKEVSINSERAKAPPVKASTPPPPKEK